MKAREMFEYRIGYDSSKKLYSLEELAESNGLIVKVRTFSTDCSDFCIFIYDKNVKSSYMVGFDGCFNSRYGMTIDYCIFQSVKWIEDYIKRKSSVK